ncbi:hypothetical protein P3W45_000549 [Vairimorpha bombi]|jgi:hypothetical protein
MLQICKYSQFLLKNPKNPENFDCKTCTHDQHLYMYIEYLYTKGIKPPNIKKYLTHPNCKIRHSVLIYLRKYYDNPVPVFMQDDPYYKIRKICIETLHKNKLIKYLDDVNDEIVLRSLEVLYDKYCVHKEYFEIEYTSINDECLVDDDNVPDKLDLCLLIKKCTVLMTHSNKQIRIVNSKLLSVFYKLDAKALTGLLTKNIDSDISGTIVYGLEDECCIVRKNTIISLYIFYIKTISKYHEENELINKEITKVKKTKKERKAERLTLEELKKKESRKMTKKERKAERLTLEELKKKESRKMTKKERKAERLTLEELKKKESGKMTKKERKAERLTLEELKKKESRKIKDEIENIKKEDEIINISVEYFVNTMNDEDEEVRNTAIYLFYRLTNTYRYKMTDDLIKQISYNIIENSEYNLIDKYLIGIFTNIRYRSSEILIYVIDKLKNKLDNKYLVNTLYEIFMNNILLVHEKFYYYTRFAEQEQELINKDFVIKILINYVLKKEKNLEINKNLDKYFEYIEILLYGHNSESLIDKDLISLIVHKKYRSNNENNKPSDNFFFLDRLYKKVLKNDKQGILNLIQKHTKCNKTRHPLDSKTELMNFLNFLN